MKNPTISILMPVKNAQNWLSETIQSILNQTLEDWELVAIDDHSKDSTWQILSNYSASDQRIKCFKNKGIGIIPALKLAYSISSGTFITRMDADDLMPSNKLRLFLSNQDLSKNLVVTGHVRYFSNKEVSDGYRSYQDWLNERCISNDHWKWIYRECIIASANWMVKRELLDFSTNQYPEDYDLVFDWYRKGFQVVALADETHLWREHPQRTSRNSNHYQQDSFFKLKIDWFIKLDYQSDKELILIGNNQKTKLVGQILMQAQISFTVFDESQLTQLNIQDQHLLICVFPPIKQRAALEKYISSKGFELGVNCWYV